MNYVIIPKKKKVKLIKIQYDELQKLGLNVIGYTMETHTVFE